MSKTFFWNTLGSFKFARAQKKSTACKTQSAKCPSGQHWQDELMIGPWKIQDFDGFCLQDFSRKSQKKSAFKILLEPWCLRPPFAPRSTGAPAAAKLQVVNSDVPPTRKVSAAPCPDQNMEKALKIWGRSWKINENNL